MRPFLFRVSEKMPALGSQFCSAILSHRQAQSPASKMCFERRGRRRRRVRDARQRARRHQGEVVARGSADRQGVARRAGAVERERVVN